MIVGPVAQSASAPIFRAGALWSGYLLSTLGVNSWSEAAAMAGALSGFAAALYSLLLCIGWCLRVYHKWKQKGGAVPPSPDSSRGDLSS